LNGGIVAQANQAYPQHDRKFLETRRYTTADIVRIGVWLIDSRDFWSLQGLCAVLFETQSTCNVPAVRRLW